MNQLLCANHPLGQRSRPTFAIGGKARVVCGNLDLSEKRLTFMLVTQ